MNISRHVGLLLVNGEFEEEKLELIIQLCVGGYMKEVTQLTH